MSKSQPTKTVHSGRFVQRRKDGRFIDVTIVQPKKGPTSTSVAEIRQAVRSTNAARKTK